MADEKKIRLPDMEEHIKIVFDGADNIAKTIRGMLAGDDYQSYLKDEKSLLEDVVNLTKEYKRAMSSGDTGAIETSGKELIKTVNALKALKGDDLSGVFKSYDKLIPTIEKAFRAFPETARIFDKQAFADAATAFNTLMDKGVDLQKLYDRFGNNSNVEKLQGDVARLRTTISDLRRDYIGLAEAKQETDRELESLKAGTGYDKLKEDLQEARRELETIRSEFSGKFSSFLQGNGYSAPELMDQFDVYFERIQEGSLTADQAIRAVVDDMGYLFPNASAAVDPTKAKFDELTNILTEMSGKIDQVFTKLNTSTNATFAEDLRQTMVAASDVSEGAKQRLEAIQPGQLQSVFDVLLEIVKAGGEAEGSVQKIDANIVQLVESMRALASVNIDNLDSVDSILRRLYNLDGAKFSSKQFDNLRLALDSISRITDLDKLSALSTVRLDGFKDLKVSKTIEHLANNLPAIASVRVGNLQKLSQVDLTKFNDLKISKANLENFQELTKALGEYAEALRVVNKASDAPKQANPARATKSTSPAAGGSDPASISADAQQATVSVGALQVALEQLKVVKSSLQKETGQIWKSEELESEKQQLKELEQLYSDWITMFSDLNSKAGKNATTEDVAATVTLLKEQAQAIREKIAAILQSRQAAQEEAAAAEEAARKEQAVTEASTEAKREQAAASRDAAKEEEEAAKKSEESQQKRFNMIKQVQGLLDRVTASQRNWTQAQGGDSSDAYASLSGYIKELEQLLVLLEKEDADLPSIKEKLASLSAEYAKSAGEIKGAGENTKTFGQRVKEAAAQFGQWFSLTRVVMMLWRELKQLVKESVEVDTKMNQLKIVTRASDDEFRKFGKDVGVIAKEIGASMTDLIDSATTYARLGYSIDESEGLAKYTSMLTKVGDIEVSDAQNAVTAIIKAYKDLDAADIETVLDKLVTVGNNFPISVEQIAAGMNNAASTLAAAGNSFEESVALLTAANTVVQNASKASTGLRTIAARLRNTKTDLEELGEDMTEANYQELVQQLTKFRVSLTDANGEFRSTYAIMKDIAAQWDNMTNMEQAALATAMSGTRQQAIFFSIVEQFKEASGAMDAMADSAGALEEAYSVRMESVEAHIDQFKASLQEIGASTFTADFLNTFIDLGTHLLKAVKGVTDLVGALGGLKTVLFAVAGVLATINANLIFNKISGFITGIPKAISGVASFARSLGEAGKAFYSMATNLDVAAADGARTTSVFHLMSDALKSAGLSASAASLAMGSLVAVIAVASIAIAAYNKHLQAVAEARKRAISGGENAANEAKGIYETYEAYQRAQKAYDQNQISTEELTKAKQDLAAAIHDEGDAAAYTSEKIQNLTFDELRRELGEVEDAVTSANAALVDLFDRREFSVSSDPVKNTMGRYLQSLGYGTFSMNVNGNSNFSWSSEYDSSAKRIQALVSIYDHLIEKRNALIQSTDHMTTATAQERAEYDRIQAVLAELGPAIEDRNSALQHEAEIRGQMSNVERGLVTTEIELADAASETTAVYKDGASIMAEFEDALDNVQSRVSSLSSALEKLKGGTLTLSDVVDLIQEFPELARYVDVTADGFGNLETGLRKLLRQSPKQLADQLRELPNLTEQQTREVNVLIDALEKMPEEPVENLSSEFGVLAEQIAASKQALTELDEKLKVDDHDANYKKQVEYYTKLQELLDAGYHTGSTQVQALADNFGWGGLGTDELREKVKENEALYKEGADGLEAFLKRIKALNESSDLSPDLASWDGAQFLYDENRLDDIAKALGMPIELVNDFIQAIRVYSDDWTREVDGVYEDIVSRFGNKMTKDDLMSFFGTGSDEDLNARLADLNRYAEEAGKVKLDVVDDEGLRNLHAFENGLHATEDEVEAANKALSEIGTSLDEIDSNEAFDNLVRGPLKELGWFDDEIDDLRRKLLAPIGIDISADDSLADIKAQFDELGIELKGNIERGLSVTSQTISDMLEKGFSDSRIREMLELAADKGIEVPTEFTVEGMGGKTFQEVLDEMRPEEDAVTVTVTMVSNGEEFVESIQTTAEAAKAALGDDWEVKLSPETGSVEQKLKDVTKLKATATKTTSLTVKPDYASFKSTIGYLDDIIVRIDKISQKIGSVSSASMPRGYVEVPLTANAKGTKHAKTGLALLGDEASSDGSPKPELVVSDGQAYLAGVNGPVIGNLKEGDVVYSNRDTKKILAGNKIKGTIPAFKTGGTLDFGGGGSGSGSGSGSGKTSSSSSSAKETADKEKSAFEQAYAYHQHLLAMEKESVKDYLNWLIGAYQAAYAANEITLEDFWKYEEEVYTKTKELFEDWLHDIEHQIGLLQHVEPQRRDINKIVALYRGLMDAVHQEAEAARARGLTNDDEYIQNLQDKWYEYRDAIAEARSEWFNGILEDQKFAIESMVDIGTDATKVVGAWKDVLTDIDAELRWYLNNGYKMTDEVVQNLISEAREARDSIISTVNDVVDGIQNVYTTLTDAAVEWAKTGYLSVDSLQSILELGPKYLSFLYDENGQLIVNEASLQKVLKARTEELTVENALVYAKQILQAAQANDTETLKALTQVMAGYAAETWDTVYGTLALAKAIGKSNGVSEQYFDDALDYVNKMKALSQTAIDTVSDYYHTLDEGYVTQAEGLDQIVELTKQLLQFENQQAIDVLNEQVKRYKEIVDAKKESLRLSKEQDDHDKSVADKLQEIAKLQSRIDQLALDNSREAQAQRLKLEEELAQKQADLADSQRDYAYDKQTDALDKDYEAFEKEKNAEIDVLENMYSSEEKLYQAAIQRIRDGWSYLYDDLIDWNTEYGNQLNETITTAWEQAAAAVQRYGGVLEAIEGVKSHIHLGPNADYEAGLIDRMKTNSAKWLTSDDAGRAQLAYQNQKLAEEYQQITGRLLHYSNGQWLREDGSSLYGLTKEEMATAIVSAMKQNSEQWRYGDKATKEYLDKLNLTLGDRLASILNEDVHRKNGVWYIGADRLYEHSFASGGVQKTAPSGGGKTIPGAGSFIPVDLADLLRGKLGDGFKSVRGILSNDRVSPSPTILTPEVKTGDNHINFSPTIHIEVAHTGELDDRAADRFGTMAAEATLSRLSDAFSRRGISTIGGALLRQT